LRCTSLQRHLSEHPAAGWQSYGRDHSGARIKYATEDRVGTAVMSQMLGATGGTLMAIAIMLSTFGCCNGRFWRVRVFTTPWPRTD